MFLPTLNLVYWVWQRFENTFSNQTILYKFAPQEFVKVNVTTDAEGDDLIETEYHPGAVSAKMRYKRTAASQSPDLRSGKVQVRVVAGGGGLVMPFVYLQLTGLTNGMILDLLVEQDGEKRAFYRIAEG